MTVATPRPPKTAWMVACNAQIEAFFGWGFGMGEVE